MAVSATSSSTDASATLAASATAASATSDRFLKLLVAQMKNQDPLNPMDNAQMTSQIAQINTVSGIDKLNTSVTGLSTQFMQMQALQGASLVGHDVVVPGNNMRVTDKVGGGGYELDAGASAVKIEVLSPAGTVVGTIDAGKQDAGLHTFTWDAGSYTSDSGLTFRVTATSGSTATAATTLVSDTVTAVNTTGNTFNLELANAGTVPYSTVKAFN